MPVSVTTAVSETLEDVAFLSGPPLNHRLVVFANAAIRYAPFRAWLALKVAVACVAVSDTRRPSISP
ncbi:hypothetical protein A8B82_01505 [Sulfitobacter sp. EhC04]|uniref:hypothetical protein n=1 Tax=Sulfitobacter sp. EhC04 TaxID=1849168 RepID=UPI0007F4E290|nr:hypothetical protein [Sulfitobacter sp. EhC04]OAN75634.1 hypothetical protein A8B82_01505 [Sulfitobacter sp. EhC04]